MSNYNLRKRHTSENSNHSSYPDTPQSEHTDTVQLIPVNNWQFFTVTERTELLSNRLRVLENHIANNTTNMPDKMNINYKIEPFSGTSSQKAFEFVQKFKSVSKFHEYSKDHQANAFPLHLEGAAALWFDNLADGSKDTIDNILTHFETKFISSAKWSNNHALVNRRQGKDEKIDVYIYAIKLLCTQLTKSSADTINYIIMGLRPNIKAFVITHNPQTLEECERLCVLGETVLSLSEPEPQKASESISAIQPAQAMADTLVKIQQQLHDTTVSLAQLKDQVNKPSNEYGPPRYNNWFQQRSANYNTNRPSHVRFSTPQSYNRSNHYDNSNMRRPMYNNDRYPIHNRGQYRPRSMSPHPQRQHLN